MPEYGPSDFAGEFNVSRETLDDLKTYAALLGKWNKAINIVAPRTVPEMWGRHFRDSAQLFPLLPLKEGAPTKLMDFGSGGGFPALVLAIMGKPHGLQVELVESDTRKAAFLRTVAHDTGTPVTITTQRAEKLDQRQVDVITARAFAPLGKILDMAAPHMGENTICVLPKGQNYAAELTDAAKEWNIELETIPSVTEAGGALLHIRKISRV